ncbi:10392_t:CDS:2, partial [Diversispora eburnea]
MQNIQATSLPNPPSILSQYTRQIDNNFLNIPSIVTSPSIPTSVSEAFLFNFQEPLTSPISQAISAPVTPTGSGAPGNNQNTTSDGKSNGSKSNSNLAHIPCKFFKSGACTAGKNCVFSHSKEPPSDNYVCKYFLKGNCKFGSKCALSHTLPNERKSSVNVRNGKNGPSRSIIPEIRSPIMTPQNYGQDINEYQPLNSPGVPFARIPISPSEYSTNSRPYSQLTASLNDYNPFSDESNSSNRLRNVAASFNNDRLSAPVNIQGQQRRSLPDIFGLETFGTSPFQPAGTKSLFFPVSYVSDSGALSPTTNPHQQLHSIPEYQQHDESLVDELCNYDYEEYIPASLRDLLTPTERERRRSRQEGSSSSLHPVHADGPHHNYYNSRVDHAHIPYGRSLPTGVSVGLTSNFMNQNDGQHLNTTGFGPNSFFPNNHNVRNITINTNFEEWNDQISPLSPLHPNNVPYSPANYPNEFQSFPGTTPAINIPLPLPHDFHAAASENNLLFRPEVGPISRPNGGTNNGNGRNSPPTDLFSPFMDDEFVFNMENDQAPSQEMSPTKTSETAPKTPLSYSAITKAGLKESGSTPGLSVDSRRYEP